MRMYEGKVLMRISRRITELRTWRGTSWFVLFSKYTRMIRTKSTRRCKMYKILWRVSKFKGKRQRYKLEENMKIVWKTWRVNVWTGTDMLEARYNEDIARNQDCVSLRTACYSLLRALRTDMKLGSDGNHVIRISEIRTGHSNVD
jgi:hypothetical protein